MGVQRLLVITDMQEWGDDANALWLLLRSPNFKVVGIVAESGNVWSDEAVVNVKKFLRLTGHHRIPVFQGLPRSAHLERLKLFERQSTAPGHYYAGAFRNSRAADLRSPKANPRAEALRILELIRSLGHVTIVNQAPSTTLSWILKLHPPVVEYLDAIYLMGGAFSVVGNASPVAEFNIWFDPEAAACVISQQLAITLLPLDATQGQEVSASTLSALKEAHDRGANKFAEYLQRRKNRTAPLWDEVLAAVLITPEIVEKEKCRNVRVNTEAGQNAALTSITAGSGSVRIICQVRRGGTDRVIVDTISGLKRMR